MTLPTPHAFLNSLFSSLFSSSPPITQSTSESAFTNPFKSLPQSSRALLISLHVLFPPPMLLQALDILDHGLVTRIILNEQINQQSENTRGVRETSPSVGSQLESTSIIGRAEENISRSATNSEYTVYQVLSSKVSQTSHRSSRYTSMFPSNPTYMVHLSSWNCSCAAFAFSAFPVDSANDSPWTNASKSDTQTQDESCRDTEHACSSFGGTLCHYPNGEGIPLCKHLLACYLGDQWKSVLGKYVKERWVGREEMAGIGAEY